WAADVRGELEANRVRPFIARDGLDLRAHGGKSYDVAAVKRGVAEEAVFDAGEPAAFDPPLENGRHRPRHRDLATARVEQVHVCRRRLALCHGYEGDASLEYVERRVEDHHRLLGEGRPSGDGLDHALELVLHETRTGRAEGKGRGRGHAAQ